MFCFRYVVLLNGGELEVSLGVALLLILNQIDVLSFIGEIICKDLSIMFSAVTQTNGWLIDIMTMVNKHITIQFDMVYQVREVLHVNMNKITEM